MDVYRHCVHGPKKSNGDANSYVKMGRNFMDFFPLFFFKWEFLFFIGKGVK